ncbi:RidA family protein [bacterium]|nr:RidA family protein [bacterium]
MKFEEKIEELFVDLPEPVSPIGSHEHIVKSGKQIFVSGQLPYSEGRLMYRGKLGLSINVDTGQAAARVCVLNILGVLKKELGSLDKIKRILKVTGYVASGGDFQDQHKVLEGALKFLKDIFGPFGKCSASAVGVLNLPLGSSVMIEMIVETK